MAFCVKTQEKHDSLQRPFKIAAFSSEGQATATQVAIESGCRKQSATKKFKGGRTHTSTHILPVCTFLRILAFLMWKNREELGCTMQQPSE